MVIEIQLTNLTSKYIVDEIQSQRCEILHGIQYNYSMYHICNNLLLEAYFLWSGTIIGSQLSVNRGGVNSRNQAL